VLGYISLIAIANYPEYISTFFAISNPLDIPSFFSLPFLRQLGLSICMDVFIAGGNFYCGA